ncbi:MAG: DUF4097 family beta strand repeat protein [Ruminococcus sp.]|nr:DUF4097 family beta strand repeat protein [Ruminococcus sp.]
MNKSMKKWLIMAVSLAAAGIAVIAGAIVAVGFDFSKLSTLKYETNTYEISEDFDKISIDTDISDVVFARSDDGSCKVVCFEAEKMKHSVRCTNGTLTISTTDDRKWYESIGFSFESPNMTIYLPQGEYSSLFVNTDTSDIDIPESFDFNKLEIENDTGNVNCMANVSDIIKIESDTGDIDVSSVASNCNIDINTDTGSIRSTDVNCTNFTAESDTGDISLVNVVAADNIAAKSHTGDVELKNSDAANLSLETDTGNITGTLLSEKIFMAKSITGDVNVPKTGTGGKCEIITDTGDIEIDIQ